MGWKRDLLSVWMGFSIIWSLMMLWILGTDLAYGVPWALLLPDVNALALPWV